MFRNRRVDEKVCDAEAGKTLGSRSLALWQQLDSGARLSDLVAKTPRRR